MTDRRDRLDAKCAWLRTSGALTFASPRDFDQLSRFGDRVTIGTATELAKIGTPTRWVHLIVEGHALADAAQSQWLLTPGAFVGDVAAFAAGTSPYTATAIDEMSALAFTASDYRRLAETLLCVRQALRASVRALLCTSTAPG